jgi:hypothetical protein
MFPLVPLTIYMSTPYIYALEKQRKYTISEIKSLMRLSASSQQMLANALTKFYSLQRNSLAALQLLYDIRSKGTSSEEAVSLFRTRMSAIYRQSFKYPVKYRFNKLLSKLLSRDN